MIGRAVARLIARLFLSRSDEEFILGDLEERHVERRRSLGPVVADLVFLRDAIASVVARRSKGIRSPWRLLSRSLLDLGVGARSALRLLARRPGFAAAAISSLALGIGSTAAVFGMVNQLLLRPIPGVRDPNGAAYLRFQSPTQLGRMPGLPAPHFDALRASNSVFSGLASYKLTLFIYRPAGEAPFQITANLVYGDYFEVAGARPELGRLLRAEETDFGADPLVAVISERLWENRFGRSPDIVGRDVELNDRPVTIVGVAGGGFLGVERGNEVDLWIPHGAVVPLSGSPPESLRSLRSTSHNQLVARLRPGVSAEAAEAEVQRVLARIAAGDPESAPYLSSILPQLFPELRLPPDFREITYRALQLLGGIVVLVLGITCANVANLLVLRGIERRGHAATRRALGASRGRLSRELMGESLALAALGTVGGLGVAWLIARAFRDERLIGMPPFEGFVVDGRVMVFGIAVTLLAAALCGALPARLVGRFDLVSALRRNDDRETGRTSWIRWGLSATQIALSVPLVVGGLLLGRTIWNLYAVDTGLDSAGVLAMGTNFPPAANDDRDDVYRDVIATVASVPGIRAVALDLYGPFSSGLMGRLRLPETPEDEVSSVAMSAVSPGWFELFGVQPVSGRTFRPEDWGATAPPRIIITESLARRFFGRTDVVGRRLVAGFARRVDAEVIGVVPDLRLHGPRSEPEDLFFQPDFRGVPRRLTILARAGDVGPATVAALRAAVQRALPAAALEPPEPLDHRIHMQLSEQRLFGRLLGLLSAIAIVLSAIGLYGVMAFAVAGRKREFGIRVALGATGSRIAGLVVAPAAAVVVAGTAGGAAAAYALSRMLEAQLFEVPLLDPASYAAGAVVLLGVAAAACWVPARAALRVEPAATLRDG